MQAIPLHTQSLVLRHFELGDAQALMNLNAEQTTRTWLPSHVYSTLDDALTALAFLIGKYAQPGNPRHGPYVLGIEHRESAKLLGHVGFSPLGEDVEISYAVAEASRGQGYGTQSMVAACRWAAAAFALNRILALTASANAASLRALVGAGFQRADERVMRFQGEHCLVSTYIWQASKGLIDA